LEFEILRARQLEQSALVNGLAVRPDQVVAVARAGIDEAAVQADIFHRMVKGLDLDAIAFHAGLGSIRRSLPVTGLLSSSGRRSVLAAVDVLNDES
jgi:hypothetical protein